MRFLKKAVFGFILTLISFGLVGIGVHYMFKAQQDRQEQQSKKRKKRPFLPTVAYDTVSLQNISPKIKAYGRINPKNKVNIRGKIKGDINYISENFKKGGLVEKNDLLLRLDSRDIDTKIADAKIALKESNHQLSDLKSKLVLIESEYALAKKQFGLYEKKYQREISLKKKGVSTQLKLDEVNLQYVNAQQSLIKLEQDINNNKMSQKLALLKIKRAKINLDKFLDDKKYTNIYAPFSGVVTDISDIIVGKTINDNEDIAVLSDNKNYEVSFILSQKQFSRIINQNDQIIPLPVTVNVYLGNRTITAQGRIDRVIPQSDNNSTGKQVFASIFTKNQLLQGNDFAIVFVQEPELQNIALLPSTALNQNQEILLIPNNAILQSKKVNVIRFIDNKVLVSGVSDKALYVTQRLPQLGDGIKVKHPLKSVKDKDRFKKTDRKRKDGKRKKDKKNKKRQNRQKQTEQQNES